MWTSFQFSPIVPLPLSATATPLSATATAAHARYHPYTCACAQSSEEYGGVAWTLGAEGELNTVFDHPAYRDDMEIQI